MTNKIIAALLHDVHITHGAVFNSKAYRCTLSKVQRRLSSEGIGFLTKTLPALGKALDRALAGDANLNSIEHGFKPMTDSELPRFLGEFFSRVFERDGSLLQQPCTTSVRVLRQVLYCFYKYELPYTELQEQQVLSSFEKTEEDLLSVSQHLDELQRVVDALSPRVCTAILPKNIQTIRKARRVLNKLFQSFDPTNIIPKHGPGAVATKQELWEKYYWTNVSSKITRMYPLDAYFYASLSHVCDRLQEFNSVTEETLPAKVILVQKDSRGPRLISAEPVDFQWIQQGLRKALVQLIERHPLTRGNVYFTDQRPNQRGALVGSFAGEYSTLDLQEASDRVSVSLVRLLFPPRIYEYLEACRSNSTLLPSGKELILRKFAPMGSSLCFPIMALTIWVLLTVATTDRDTRECIFVYGDDVIVPTSFVVNAIEQLEEFGLKINRSKSCTKGLFRESCGMDAFKGICVTPVRIKTVWSSLQSPDEYESYIAYANAFFRLGWTQTCDTIARELFLIYGTIPDGTTNLCCPRLLRIPIEWSGPRHRINHVFQSRLQRRVEQWKVRVVTSAPIRHVGDPYIGILRFFTGASLEVVGRRCWCDLCMGESSVQNRINSAVAQSTDSSSYTPRHSSKLVWRWLPSFRKDSFSSISSRCGNSNAQGLVVQGVRLDPSDCVSGRLNTSLKPTCVGR